MWIKQLQLLLYQTEPLNGAMKNACFPAVISHSRSQPELQVCLNLNNVVPVFNCLLGYLFIWENGYNCWLWIYPFSVIKTDGAASFKEGGET